MKAKVGGNVKEINKTIHQETLLPKFKFFGYQRPKKQETEKQTKTKNRPPKMP